MLEENKQTEFDIIQNESLNLKDEEQVEVNSDEEVQTDVNEDQVAQEGASNIEETEVQEESVEMTDLTESIKVDETPHIDADSLGDEMIGEVDMENLNTQEKNAVNVLKMLNELKTVSETSALGVETFTAPKKEEILGRIDVVKTVGGVEVSAFNTLSSPGIVPLIPKVFPQGTAIVSFKLSGEVLSLIPKYDFSKSIGSNKTNFASKVTGFTLGTLIQNAYAETIKDANTGYTSSVLTERKILSDALQNIFGGNGSNHKVKLIFKSSSNDIRIMNFTSYEFFPSADVSESYSRYIIDMDTIDATLGRSADVSRSRVPSEIPVKMIVRINTPNDKNSLKTDTDYTFVGIQDNALFSVNTLSSVGGVTGGKKYLEGFTMSGFKTGKSSSKFETVAYGKEVSSTNSTGTSSTVNIVFNGIKSSSSDKEFENYNTDLYVSRINDKTYIDMKVLTDASHINSSGEVITPTLGTTSVIFLDEKIEPTGTTIKFKPLIFTDKDKTITKLEMEDDRGDRYKGQLIPKDSSQINGPAYLEVVGLQRGMPYIFKKLHITSKTSKEDVVNTVYFKVDPDGSSMVSAVIIDNNLPIMTTYFYGPKLQLIGKVECDDTIHASTPHKDPSDKPIKPVKLIEGIEVPPVKNDRTGLMYILKPDTTEGTLGELVVNGLNGEENFKVDTTLDSNGKVSYYTLKLTGLMPDRDYSFLMLELSYKDPEGNSLVTRQSLYDINNQTTCLLGDNKTEKTELPANKVFLVVAKEVNTATDPRAIDVPIFIDDMYDNFLGIKLTAPKESPNAQAVYEKGKIKFSNLTPDTTAVYKVDFSYKTGNNGGISTFVRSNNSSTAQISRYITITTPKIQDLDIKSVVATPSLTSAEFKFEYYSEPKSSIKTVVVKDNSGKEIKSSFDKATNILKVEGLIANTKYSGVEVSFTLENGKVVKYILEPFTTTPEVVKPTGKVAEFVAKVYKFALGREPEVEGWKFWIDKLESKELSVTQFICDLMKQDEFVNKLISKDQFVKMMYEIIVGREPEEEGQKYWEQKYDEYRSQEKTTADTRIRIAKEMMDTQEFKDYVSSLGLKY